MFFGKYLLVRLLCRTFKRLVDLLIRWGCFCEIFLQILNCSQIDASRVEDSETVCQVDEDRPDIEELDEAGLFEDDSELEEFSDVVWSVEPTVNPGCSRRSSSTVESEIELSESSKSLCTKSIIFMAV